MPVRSGLVVVPLLGVLVATTGCAADRTPLAAPTAESSVSRTELVQRQTRLGVVAREIQDLVDPLEGPIAKRLPSGENRYGEVRIDLERDVVELWWAGDLPPEAAAVLQRHPAVDVEVHRARYSNNELQGAGRRVATTVRGGLLGTDVTVDAVEHDVRAGRVTVHVVDPGARWTTAQLHRLLDPLTSVPLDVVDQREPTLHGL